MDWSNFTPYTSLLGGMVIGLSAVILLWMNGRIAGISGILGGMLHDLITNAQQKTTYWRWAFILGLLSAPIAYQTVHALPTFHVTQHMPTLVIAGLLVGFGTRLGAGCTSGHGICGLSRLSLRSLVATTVFMVSGMVSVFVMHQWHLFD